MGLGVDPTVLEYPRKMDLGEFITELMDKGHPMSSRFLGKDKGLVGQISTKLEQELAVFKACNDPRGVYARMPLEIRPE